MMKWCFRKPLQGGYPDGDYEVMTGITVTAELYDNYSNAVMVALTARNGRLCGLGPASILHLLAKNAAAFGFPP